MDLDGFSVIHSRRKENRDWEQSGVGLFVKDYFFSVCVCVLSLNTKLGKQRFVFIGTPEKVPKSVLLCLQPCRLK